MCAARSRRARDAVTTKKPEGTKHGKANGAGARNLDARRTSAFEQRDRAKAQAHGRHREGASAQHFRQARAAQSHATRDACQCSTSTMTANWTLTTIIRFDP